MQSSNVTRFLLVALLGFTAVLWSWQLGRCACVKKCKAIKCRTAHPLPKIESPTPCKEYKPYYALPIGTIWVTEDQGAIVNETLNYDVQTGIDCVNLCPGEPWDLQHEADKPAGTTVRCVNMGTGLEQGPGTRKKCEQTPPNPFPTGP